MARLHEYPGKEILAAKKPAEARAQAERMLAMSVGQFPIETVLVDEKIAIPAARC